MIEPQITIIQALEYEVRSSWWAKHISRTPLQRLVSWYFARKVNRKMARYRESERQAKRLRMATILLDLQKGGH